MDLGGYRINNQYYCNNCAREYCLFNLCTILTDNEMVKLMPTKNLETELIVKLMNKYGGDINGDKIHPYGDFDFSKELRRIRYLSELVSFDERQCVNYHDFSHPNEVLLKNLYK